MNDSAQMCYPNQPVLNVELLDLVLKTIKTDPKHWDQGSWRTDVGEDTAFVDPETGQTVYEVSCNTSFCFAGWAIQLGSQSTPKWVYDGILVAEPEDENAIDGICSAGDRALRLLGLTENQAYGLFGANNAIEDLESIVNRIKEESQA